jgi:Fe2+ or Zn2+ uptake regulation protein
MMTDMDRTARHDPGSAPVDISALLRSRGLKATRPRVAVMTALEQHPHADADALTDVARDRLGRVSVQTVYDVLRALTEASLVRRIEPAGSSARYELRVGDNHHHVVCRACGAIADVDCAVGESPCLSPSDFLGFVIDEAEVTYWGLCPECSASHTTIVR